MADERRFSAILEEILYLQPRWSKENTPDMERRGRLIRGDSPSMLREWVRGLNVAPSDVGVEGSDGVGLKARVPWVRIFSKGKAPSATTGWYLVYLFAADGSSAFLSLNQGTTDPRAGGGFGRRPSLFLAERVSWARALLGSHQLPERSTTSIELHDVGLGLGYEQGNVVALRYGASSIPDDGILRSDLEKMLTLLNAVYGAETDVLQMPNGYGPGEALYGFSLPAPFNEETVGQLQNVPGVHVVWDLDGELIYVGSTSRQRDRLRQHLTGDRQASVLHDKVGRQLDAELGSTATRDQIRSFLERCKFAARETESTDSLKARIMDELRPRFNDIRPRTQEDPLVLAVYVGQRAEPNFRIGLEARTWGFPERRDDYDRVRVGDWILLASGYGGGSPRTSIDEWTQNALAEVIIGRITRPPYEDETPLWPDEKVATAKYAHRVQFETVEKFTDVPLSNNAFLSADVADAIRRSATHRGLGYVAAAVGQAFEGRAPSPEVLADLAFVCQDFASALVEANLDFGKSHMDVVRTFVVSLATKRLALLTGLSGSGKTRMAIGFGKWLGEAKLLVLPVRPDWTGPEALLGYEDALLPSAADGRRAWSVPLALEFMLRAASDPEWPYLLLLDEMNLAHVERYFSDVLSGMESDERVLPDLAHDTDGLWRLNRGGPDRLEIPKNLFVAGTVNVDETTYMFSPKVLDRANTIEFRVLAEDLRMDALRPGRVREGDAKLVRGFLHVARDETFQATRPADNRDEIARRLQGLHNILSTSGFEFGHRTFYEALRFAALLQAAGDGSPWRALDLQVKQKILPRLHGSIRRVREPLAAVAHFCYDPASAASEPNLSFDPESTEGSPALPESFEKVKRMMRSLRANQFVSFSE